MKNTNKRREKERETERERERVKREGNRGEEGRLRTLDV